ncbi:N-acetyltransferase [Microbacterium sp. W1N]|uniref:N-acetyltransferase n=1 Tax=Microbacterium festucae TaxID=2977531 RepID=UPI0021C14DD3|nr:N-acetyltransferase [Microbacterium festucae]MCT9821027.1 N-acetyltransferase [Microbacterium festucae]
MSTVFTDPSAVVPTGLVADEFVLRPILATDAQRDHAAVVETTDDLRLWEQSTWPADGFTVEENRVDLVDLEERHRAHRAFTFTVLDPDDTECLGCVYIFPTTAGFLAKCEVIAVADAAWADVDAVVYFWARASRVATGMDERLLAALRAWFSEEWRFDTAVYAASEPFVRQLELIRGTDLALQFELREPDKPAPYLLFG